MDPISILSGPFRFHRHSIRIPMDFPSEFPRDVHSDFLANFHKKYMQPITKTNARIDQKLPLLILLLWQSLIAVPCQRRDSGGFWKMAKNDQEIDAKCYAKLAPKCAENPAKILQKFAFFAIIATLVATSFNKMCTIKKKKSCISES